VIVFLVSESEEKSIGDKLDILFHELGIDAQQRAWKTVSQETLFDSDCFRDDVLNDLFAGSFAEVTEEETCKVRVETFVSGDEFVGKGQAGHETTFLEPEDGGEGSGEEDPFNGGKSYETFCECGVLICDPTEGPFCFGLDAGN